MTIVSPDRSPAPESTTKKRERPPAAAAIALKTSREANCLTLEEVARRWNLCTGESRYSASFIWCIERASEASRLSNKTFVQAQAAVDAGPAGTSDEDIVARWDEMRDAEGAALKQQWRDEGASIARAVWNSNAEGRQFLDMVLSETLGNKKTSVVQRMMGGSYLEVNEYRARVALMYLADMLRLNFPDRLLETDVSPETGEAG